ncbi:MAG TPA: AraC family transcriptional regulator [Burkholderiaceae bacterium]|nr:AraC family transcriptional regulator [Burkholderiaceae bacterium]
MTSAGNPRAAACDATMDGQDLSHQFLARAASPAGFDELFDFLPDVYFFVKDGAGRFVRVNQAFVKLVRARSEADVLGACDSDFFPPDLAESYVRDDREVVESSRPIVDKAELVRNTEGSVDWFCTTKLPVLDATGATIGVCGITRDVKKMNETNARFLSWAPVIETMLNDYAKPLETASLAQKVALSVSQFNRQFRKRFHTTPRNYLTNIRLNAACHYLVSTELSMSEIAQRTGFYDQAHFTNHFVKTRGLPPSKYRALHAQLPGADNLTPSEMAVPAVSKTVRAASKLGAS